MKTIKQLEKGCGKRTEAQAGAYIRGINCGDVWKRTGRKHYCEECQVQLSQTKVIKALIAMMNKLMSIEKSLFTSVLVITKNQKELAEMLQAMNTKKEYKANIETLSDKKLLNIKHKRGNKK